MPSNSAARVLLFLVFCRVRMIICRSTSSSGVPTGSDMAFVAQTFALFDWIRSEMMAFDLFAGTDDYRTFDYVAKFADIARPGMKLKRFELRGSENVPGVRASRRVV